MHDELCKIVHGNTGGRERKEIIFRVIRDRERARDNDAKQTKHNNHTDKSPLFRKCRKDKVGLEFR